MSTENQKIDIILDCAPGYDDAAAILLAAGNPNVNILAITVVAGNQSIAKVTRNALAIAQVAGLHDVPIAAGATRPLMIEPEVAAEIHGETVGRAACLGEGLRRQNRPCPDLQPGKIIKTRPLFFHQMLISLATL